MRNGKFRLSFTGGSIASGRCCFEYSKRIELAHRLPIAYGGEFVAQNIPDAVLKPPR